MLRANHLISPTALKLLPTIAVFGAGTALLYALYNSLLPKPLPGIPYNEESSKRLMGDLPDVAAYVKAGGRRKRWWAHQAQKLESPIVQFFFGPGTGPYIIVADYREVRDILLRRSKEVIRGDMVVGIWGGVVPNHFISMEDDHPHYKEVKALAKDLMTPRFLHNVSVPACYEMALNLIRLWKIKADVASGAPFSAEEDLNHLSFDIMAAAAVDIPPNEGSIAQYLEKLQANRSSRVTRNECIEFPSMDIPELFDALLVSERAAGTAIGFPFPRLFHFFNNHFRSKVRWAENFRNSTLQSYINRASERQAIDPRNFKPRSAVDHMVCREAETSGRDTSFDSEKLRDGLWGYMIGGQESTHTTLCFAAKRLGRQQEAQKKLREALRQAFGDAHHDGRQPTADEITKVQVPYLNGFIQEVLRMDPPASATAKEAACDMVILGHVIPKGTLVVLALDGPTVNQKGASVAEERRSESSRKYGEPGDWADSKYPCDEFWPERWIQGEGVEATYDGAAGPFLSFGNGPRGCWGKRLAYLELKLITTLLIWNFHFDELPTRYRSWDVDERIFGKPKETLVRIRSV